MDLSRRRLVVNRKGAAAPPGPSLLDMALYIPADPSDDGPPSLLRIDPITGRMMLFPDIGAGPVFQHREVSYGQIYVPSYDHGPDVEIRQKYWTGHNNSGDIDGSDTNQRFSPFIGINGKYQDYGAGGHTTLDPAGFVGPQQYFWTDDFSFDYSIFGLYPTQYGSAGGWTVVGGALVLSGGDGARHTVFASTTDGRARAHFNSAVSGDFGIGIQGADGSAFVFRNPLFADDLQLSFVSPTGVQTIISDVGWSPPADGEYWLEIERQGSTINARLRDMSLAIVPGSEITYAMSGPEAAAYGAGTVGEVYIRNTTGASILDLWYGDLSAPTFDVVDTTNRFPDSGTLRLVSGDNQLLLNYTERTPTSFGGLTNEAEVTEVGFDYNWPADTIVQALTDNDEQTSAWDILGLFGWWDLQDGGFGMYYSSYADVGSWQDFGSGPKSTNADNITIEVGRLGGFSTITEAIDALDEFLQTFVPGGSFFFDGSTTSVEVGDTTGFPSSGEIQITAGGNYYIRYAYTGIDATHFTGLTYIEGVTGAWPAFTPTVRPAYSVELADASDFPETADFPASQAVSVYIYDASSDPIDVGNFVVPVLGLTYRTKVGNSLRGVAFYGNNTSGTPHTFAIGAKATVVTWFSTPMEDGLVLDYSDVRGYNDSFLYLDDSYAIACQHGEGAIQPDMFVWQILRFVGNRIDWEIWKEDPDEPGSTFLLRMSVELTSAQAIAAFGAAVSGGFGPAGWWEPSPTSYIAEWSYS